MAKIRMCVYYFSYFINIEIHIAETNKKVSVYFILTVAGKTQLVTILLVQ